MKIINPEKECKTAPENFSGESKITHVEVRDYRRGIILDSPEELAQALIVYDGGSVDGSRATQNNLMDAMGNKGQGMGAALLVMSGTMNASGFTGKLTQDVLSALKSTGAFNRHFDYNAMGTNFFKTTVDGRKAGDKYVLELNAAYVGTAPENELAKTLGKPRALVRSAAEGKLNIVDDWWFNVNLEDILSGLPIPKEQLKGLPGYIASHELFNDEPKIIFEHQGQKFKLDIRLDADSNLRPEGGKYGSEYMLARGNNVVGGAWTSWGEHGRIAPKPSEPSIELFVSIPGERYTRPVAVTEEQMKAVQSARDYLADSIIEKL